MGILEVTSNTPSERPFFRLTRLLAGMQGPVLVRRKWCLLLTEGWQIPNPT